VHSILTAACSSTLQSLAVLLSVTVRLHSCAVQFVPFSEQMYRRGGARKRRGGKGDWRSCGAIGYR